MPLYTKGIFKKKKKKIKKNYLLKCKNCKKEITYYQFNWKWIDKKKILYKTKLKMKNKCLIMNGNWKMKDIENKWKIKENFYQN